MEDYAREKLGKRIREIRISKNITLRDVGEKTGLTPSFISQFERGLTQASIGSINKIADAIDAKMATLFMDDLPPENNFNLRTPSIVRVSERKRLDYPGLMRDYLLTDPKRPLEAFYGEILPNASSAEAYTFNGDEEFILILEGELRVEIENESFTLYKGDSIGFEAQSQHRWWNTTDSVTKLIWVVSKCDSQPSLSKEPQM